MKALIILGLLALVHPHAVCAADDPFAVPAQEPPRQERPISKLPAAVTHRKTADDHHEYRISGIYSASAKERDPKDTAPYYKSFVPECLGLDLDFKQLTATFSTSRELSFSELAYAVDDMAAFGGDIPYWVELEARDLATSKKFPDLHYLVQTVDEPPPSALAWFWIPKDCEFRIPLSLGGPDLFSLLIVPSTAFCMSCSRFNMRILDPDGRVIWKDEKTAFAGVKVALSEGKENGMHKIWLTRDDHGEQARFVITGSFQKPKEIEQAVPPNGP